MIDTDQVIRNASIPIGKLRPHPENYQTHSADQVARLRASLQTFGQVRSIVVQAPTAPDGDYIIVAGHGITEAAKAQGLPAMRSDVLPAAWTPERVKAYLIADNELGKLATPDETQLVALLEEVRAADYALFQATGVDEARLAAMLRSIGKGPDGPADPGAKDQAAAELGAKWSTAAGMSWALGDHLLVCGDCTDAATVAAALGGSQIDLWVSDPPYGVDYAAKNEYLNAAAKGNRVQTPIEGDALDAAGTADLWRRSFGLVFNHAKPGCVYYVNAPQGGESMVMMQTLAAVGWLLKPQIIWVKNNHVLGRSDYQLKHEPILYGWKDGSHFWCGSRSEMSVWEIDKPTSSDLHPTTKPVALAERAITNSSAAGDLVFDGFVGSGTVLIACERLGRRCVALEVSPAYCGVVLERWHEMTGRDPVVISGVE